MGYTTYFNGTLKFNKPIAEELKTYINNFANVRHMKRSNAIIQEIDKDWENHCYHGLLGDEGEYYIGGTGFMGQDHDDSILEYNYPPQNIPGLWCKWYVNDNEEIEWDGSEKFYDYVKWLEYLIHNFFEPEGYILNGEISYQGEDNYDFGIIRVTNNIVNLEEGLHIYSLNVISDEELLEECKKRNLL